MRTSFGCCLTSFFTHFQLITRHSDSYLFTEARKFVNQSKNRNMSIIPVDQYRVCITPKPGEPGTDYINATFMPVS